MASQQGKGFGRRGQGSAKPSQTDAGGSGAASGEKPAATDPFENDVSPTTLSQLISAPESRAASSLENDPDFVELRNSLFNDLLESISLVSLAALEPEEMRETVMASVTEFVRDQDLLINASEEEKLIHDLSSRLLNAPKPTV